MTLTIQERLKDLRVAQGITLEQLAEQTNLSKSALGSYEADEFKDISHFAILKLAKFYGVTADYLLGLAETKNHPNADPTDLHLSDDMIALLKSGRVNNSLLCEMAAHPDFPRLMADLEIYVNGVAGQQIQSANALVDAARASVMGKYNPSESDPHMRHLAAAHISDDGYCRYTIQQDIDRIAKALREIHKDDMSSISQDNVAEHLTTALEEGERYKGSPAEMYLMFICKVLRLNFRKLTEEEKQWISRIAQKSSLLKNPIPQRGKHFQG